MIIPAVRRWIMALGLTAVLCVLAIAQLDRPIAAFFDKAEVHTKVFNKLLLGIEALVPLGAVGILWCGYSLLRKERLNPVTKLIGASGLAIFLALPLNELILKPLFGRWTSEQYLKSAAYGFRLFGGAFNSGFPSGHAALVASFLCVCWCLFPKWR